MQKARKRSKLKDLKHQQSKQCLSSKQGIVGDVCQSLDNSEQQCHFSEPNEYQDHYTSESEPCTSKDLSLTRRSSLARSTTTNCQYIPSLSKNIDAEGLQERLQQAVHDNRTYRRRLQEQDKKVKLMAKEYRLSVLSIRHFWKDMIYKECSRGGKILKMAIRNSTC